MSLFESRFVNEDPMKLIVAAGLVASSAHSATGGSSIVVLAGEGAVNIIQQEDGRDAARRSARSE